MYYFRFEIPLNSDGTRVSYSPVWCGTRERCAKNEKGLLYNDKEGWGIGEADGDFVPPDVTILTKGKAIQILSEVKDEEGVFFGDKLAHRWDAKPLPFQITPESLEAVTDD